MNKKFLSAILFGALVATTGSFVSCADNDDKISQLENQNGELKAQLAQLKSDLQAELKAADNSAKVAAIEAKLSLVENATPENIAATVAALTGNFATKEAVDLAISAQKEALAAIQGDIDELKEADLQAVLQALDKAKENSSADMGVLSAMIDALDADVNVLYAALRGLVFQPDFYVDGIEATEYTYLKYVALDPKGDKYEDALSIWVYNPATGYWEPKPGRFNDDSNPVTIDKDFVWRYAHAGEIQDEVTDYNHSSNWSWDFVPAKDNKGKWDWSYKGDKVINKMQFAMNPSNANVKPEDLEFITKNVAAYTRANAVDIKVVDVKPENGILTVYYTIPDAQIKNIITANNRENYSVVNRKENTTIAKLQAATVTENKVESDWAAIYETSIQPIAIALNSKAVGEGWYAPITCGSYVYDKDGNLVYDPNGNASTNVPRELSKNPYEALAWYENTFSLMYDNAEGIDLADYLAIHMSKRADDPYNFSTGSSNGTGERKTPHTSYSLKEAKELFDLDVEFNLVPYTADQNATKPSNYVTLTSKNEKGHVVANIVDENTGEPKTGVQGASSVGKMPLVQVLVKRGADVILDAYVRILIDREITYKTVATFDLGKKAYSCQNIEFAQTWNQVSTLLYEAVGASSKDEFTNDYYLNYDQSYYEYVESGQEKYRRVASWYTSDGKKYIEESKRWAKVTEYQDYNKTTNNILVVEMNAAQQRYVWEMPNHSATIYVRYAPNGSNGSNGVGTAKPYVIVPLTVTVSEPNGALTYAEKIKEYWYKADGTYDNQEPDEALRLNVNEPVNNGNTREFVADLKSYFVGNTVKFNNAEGAEFQFADKSKAGSKFYFHPATNGVTVTNEYTKEVYYLSVDKNYVECDVWDKTVVGSYDEKYPYNSVTKEHINTGNATKGWTEGQNLATAEQTQALELKHMLNSKTGMYTNKTLYAHTKSWIKVDGKDKQIDNPAVEIATISESGVVTYLNNETAKAVLNATNHKNATAMAYVGLAALDQCDHVLPVADNVFPIYFLRPLDVEAVELKDGQDAIENGSSTTIFDKFKFNDWREVPFVKGDDYSKIWLAAYYNIKKVTVDFNKATTNLNGSDLETKLLKDVSTAVRISYIDKSGNVKADNLASTAEPAVGDIPIDMDAFDKASMGVKSTYDAFVKHFGSIRYDNNNAGVGTFKVKVPVTFTYDWGESTEYVTLTFLNTLGN